eukprot:TRINITY_DN4623_c0_g1_i2.p1 TRINITY_DN4623_c0_g1~~TRINITY_DN4623_c0_g1_i2.p1  ORF type:complete len:755 (-),score=155.99 TRINITY_DN4623_c0_g1_i2:89-2353(-)
MTFAPDPVSLLEAPDSPPGLGGNATLLRWSEVSLQIDDYRVLNNVSGSCTRGEMQFVFGPSGSGKTSLLHLLAGLPSGGTRTGTLTGTKNVTLMLDDDTFYGTQTVYEVLYFEAQLGLDLPHALLERVLQLVLEDFDLSGQKDAQVGGSCSGGFYIKSISRGQLRRLTVACRLLRFYTHRTGDPASVILADEPLSGLDSATAVRVLRIFHTLTRHQGHGVILTIHQPSKYIWDHFPSSCSLLSRGTCVYSGPKTNLLSSCGDVFGDSPRWHSQSKQGAAVDDPPDFALRFFSNLDPFELELMTGAQSAARDLENRDSQPIIVTCTAAQDVPVRVTRLAFEFAVVVRRLAQSMLRNRATWASRVGVHLLISVLTIVAFAGTSSDQDGVHARIRLFAFFLIALMITPILAVGGYVFGERIDDKDIQNELFHPLSLCLGYQVVETCIGAVNAMCFLFVPTVAILETGSWLTVFATGIMLHTAVAHTYFLFAQIVPIPDVAFVLCAGQICFNALAAGFFVVESALASPLQELQWLCPIKYALSCLIDVSVIQRGQLTGVSDFDDSSLTVDRCLAALIAYFVAVEVALLATFHIKHRRATGNLDGEYEARHCPNPETVDLAIAENPLASELEFEDMPDEHPDSSPVSESRTKPDHRPSSFDAWLRTNSELVKKLFSRYADQSGTLDTFDMECLSLNLVTNLGLNLSLAHVDTATQRSHSVTSGGQWNYQHFTEWFYDAFVSSPLESSGVGPGTLDFSSI